MVRQKMLIWLSFLFFIFAHNTFAAETEEYYYAIEQNGVVCGYAHVIIAQTEFNGRPAVQLIDSLWMQMSAMGKSFEGKYLFEYRIDPATGMYFYHTSAIDQGGLKIGGTMEVRGDTMYITSSGQLNDTSAVALPPGTLRQNTRIHKYLVDFFVNDTLTQKECPVFNEVDGTINTVTYISHGLEKLQLAGKTYDALMVESIDRKTGIQVKTWVDAATGLLLKASHPMRDGYLADATIKDRMGRANLDEHLFVQTNKVISDPWAVSYMKVQAVLQPGGGWMTKEGLNVPGQKFEGTVQDNRIDGIFEISHARYDGAKAPAFPCDFSGIDSLRPYLQATDLIESNDSTLIRKAGEITAGAKDAWDAATRLSRWVNKEIGYDIPGGCTALKTYETRLGECGSHSNLLAAFCRTVGIPARCVFGCMYVPDHGGVFGQHAWNEIYMGEAGWIPVDCTVDEVTYVDCGHIRLCEWNSKAMMFNPEKFQILDYQTAEASSPAPVDTAAAQYNKYVGDYLSERGKVNILVREGCLAFEIPERNTILDLKDPDDSGHWYFKLTAAASIVFETDSSGAVLAMTIHERQRMPRQTAVDSAAVDSTVPDTYRPLVGVYTIPMQNATIAVAVQDGRLMLHLPGNAMVALSESETGGQWLGQLSPGTSLTISFDTDETRQVTAMQFAKMTRATKAAASGNQ